ncbi:MULTISPECIES: sulfur carrier protein ThiS [Paenibacillus]|uniref:Sulfur carrier protein ThiS n=2 Tax=Paenibacillus TaxID=44249 RepID=A0ABU3RFI5_9BACL|nr:MULTISPECIES: sulfur carrier protein ThiS [Paenibacillus]MCY9657652.1 sulfur carrier protein ThiS [Paenibacillus anseongense]MDU0202831.1 sulfur carrier protein ThiS [Paenibacillus sp. PFR10]MEB4798107.1 sulfur carrier protein ThiS [Paenibacillus chondroitinus]MEC0266629.1 sulfur carrier protein ThiS [Paenibacillus anseongense]
MKLHINGQSVEVPDAIRTIEELLAHFELQEKMLVVEHNQNILQKEDHVKTELSEGHKIEIVHFVGGG